MKKLFLFPLFMAFVVQAENNDINQLASCSIIGIDDGNTITCLLNGEKQVKVKLYEIEAPQPDQDYGREASKTLTNLVGYSKLIKINYIYKKDFCQKNDKDCFSNKAGKNKQMYAYIKQEKTWSCGNGDMYATCIGPVDINLEMLNAGMAWALPNSSSEYQQAEKEARQAKKGLWSQPDPIPPWEWRKKK